MTFLHPAFLPIGAAVALVVVFGTWRHARRRRRLAEFLGGSRAAERLSRTNLYRLRMERMLLLGGATLAVAGAAAEPRAPEVGDPAPARTVVIAIDVSASMQADDEPPNRLGRAVEVATDMVEALGRDRVGLLLFSGTTYPLAPPTSDHRVIRDLLTGVTPTMASAHDPGTLLATAVREAAALATGSDAPDAERWIVLISDGDTSEMDEAVLAEVRAAREQGIRIHAVGVGSDERTELVMPRAPYQLGGPVLDESGDPATSALDGSLLGRIAQDGGGRYAHAGDDAVEDIRRSFARPADSRSLLAGGDYGFLLILVALGALLVESALDLRAPRRQAAPLWREAS